MKIHIETEQLILRDIEEYDVNGIYALDSDPDVHEFLGKKPITTINQAKEMISYIRNQYTTHGIGRWAIIDKKTQDFIGWTGLKYEQEVRKQFNYYDIGYRIRKKYWGKGIATKTSIACLKYGFEKMDLNEISAAASINHVVSNRILSKIGLKCIETFEFDGEIHNWYNIKKEEWLTLTSNTKTL